MPALTLFLPSHSTSTIPYFEVRIGFEGTDGGVTSEATRATTGVDHSPNRSEYVGTALTRNSYFCPHSRPPMPSLSTASSVTPPLTQNAPAMFFRYSTR